MESTKGSKTYFIDIGEFLNFPLIMLTKPLGRILSLRVLVIEDRRTNCLHCTSVEIDSVVTNRQLPCRQLRLKWLKERMCNKKKTTDRWRSP